MQHHLDNYSVICSHPFYQANRVHQQKETQFLMQNIHIEESANVLRPPYLMRIAARRIDMPIDHDTPIDVEEILYFFLGSAVTQRLIDHAWQQQLRFQRDRVYLRTRKGVYVTRFRSLRQLQARLNAETFAPIHQSLLVNLKKIVVIDLDNKLKQVIVALDEGKLEALTVSRRFVKSLRFRFGLICR
jgi:hypothetical protein